LPHDRTQTQTRTNDMTTTNATNATNYWTATATATAATGAWAITKHIPGFKLTKEQRDIKSDEHQFGLCCSCDAGLDDRADFICDTRENGGFALMCNACSEFYTEGPGYAEEDI
jgi:hypothetical protein